MPEYVTKEAVKQAMRSQPRGILFTEWELDQVPTVDAVEVVYCDTCVAHGSCVFEPVLHCLGYKKPFCCAGKMDGGV